MPFDSDVAFAESHDLAYVHDHDPGIRREGKPGAFDYVDPKGRQVRDAKTLERIRSLAIPPAWTEVWICPDESGHIQAVGRDAKGRKQYRYHPGWSAHRDEAKYHRLLAFGRKLPRLRAKLDADLALPGLPREKVLAAVVRLLELTLVRVGNDEYAKANEHYGLTTLRPEHVHISRMGAVFEFRGKSGVDHRTELHDPRLIKIIRRCGELRGERLFEYADHDGQPHAIGSREVNAYIHEAMGEDFSAKTFRTWMGTVLAAQALAMQPEPESEAQAKRTINTCVKAAAGILGNTAAVCRKAYIHPVVFDAWREGRLEPRLKKGGRDAELAVLKLLGEAKQEG